MVPASRTEYLTPRAASLTLRSASDPSDQRMARHGDALRVTGRLSGGFVEVEYQGGRWLATESALEPWSAGLGSPPPATPPYATGSGRIGGAGARDPAFPGAVVVGRIFQVAGFIIIGLGVLIGLILAVAYPGTSSAFGSGFGAASSDDTGMRIFLFFLPALAGCLYALPLLAFGYMLLLLDAVEINTRR